MDSTISIILLAAGESSRLGTPKQLLMYKDKPMLQHSINMTRTLGLETVLVLGAYSDQILGQVDTYDIKVVQNENWHEGLASSVRSGLEGALMANPDMEAVILMLCDQPLLTLDIIEKMIDKYLDSALPIVHCDYGKATGPPTLFHQSMFPNLLQLQGQEGAKKVVKTYTDKVALVDFADGKWDIDTMEDYQNLLDNQDRR